MEDYKEVNRKAYDSIARRFEQRTSSYLIDHLLPEAKNFLMLLPGNKILDLGSGSGRDSLFFKQQGFDPLCFDISPEMVANCKEKGLNAVVGDIEELDFPQESFDGVWAYTSLVHVPKSKFRTVLSDVKNILKKSGMLYLSMKEGNFEGVRRNDMYGVDRVFSLYSPEELMDALSENFTVLTHLRLDTGHVYLNYLARRKD